MVTTDSLAGVIPGTAAFLPPLPQGEGWGEGIKNSRYRTELSPHPNLLSQGAGTPGLNIVQRANA